METVHPDAASEFQKGNLVLHFSDVWEVIQKAMDAAASNSPVEIGGRMWWITKIVMDENSRGYICGTPARLQ